LEQAYVDPIDTNKPFRNRCECHVAISWIRTEFEGAQEAVRIERKYG
jgi:hypothetical protein